MRCARFGLLFSILFLTVPVWAQQAQTMTTPSPAPKDPQAVSVLNQALGAAGGIQAIRAITDYTATGTITYHWSPEVQGNVTVRGLGLDEFRLDASLPTGVRSWAIQEGTTTRKAENGAIWQYPPPYPIPSSDSFPYQPPMFPGSLALPYLQLVRLLSSGQFSLSYKGIVQVNGFPAHDVLAQRVFPGRTQPDRFAEYHVEDIFIDTATLQLVMTRDNVPRHIVHQIRYADHKLVNGVLVPFSIGEEVGEQHTWDLQLGQINFNTGLQDSAFALQ